MTQLVLSRHVPESAQQRIRAAVPGVKIISDRRAELAAAGRVGLLYREEDRTEPEVVDDEELAARWRSLLADADVLFDLHPAAMDLVAKDAPRLSFIQGIAAGAGELLAHEGIRTSGITITTARGVHDDGLADFAFGAILAHVKRFDVLRVNQTARRWEEIAARPISGATILIVGFGSIGEAVARRAQAFNMRVTCVRSRPRPHPLADVVFGADDIMVAVAAADFVVNALPASPATAGLFNTALFAALKPGAFFVNVGRGATVDEPALIDALSSGRLAGAAIDVAVHEPLPAGDPLWSAPNLLISPHCASLIPGDAFDRIIDILIANLQHLEAGEPLVNVATRDGHQA